MHTTTFSTVCETVLAEIEGKYLMNIKLLFTFDAGILFLLISSCWGCGVSTSSTSSDHQALMPTPKQEAVSSIRSVDFNEVAYPNHPLPNGTRTTLKPGEAAPEFIAYGDVTNDGIEEAIIVMPIQTHGTAIPHHIYIYALKDHRPLLLWDFETCDRADGGLRQVSALEGKLVVELYGRNKVIGTTLCADDGTRKEHPYPYLITRSRYIWDSREFRLTGDAEVFSNSEGYGAPTMSPRS